MNMKIDFKKSYAIIVLVVFIIYGWLYLCERRFISVGDTGTMFDTWTQTYKPVTNFIDEP